MPAKVNVALIGCGLIGTQWDAALPGERPALTHAAAFSRNPLAALVAVCDADGGKAHQAAARWGAQHAYTDVRALFRSHRIDLAVIATPSAVRWPVIEPALAAGVKVLVIEKPLAPTLAESRQIAAAVSAAGVRTVVNYTRHWDCAMLELRTAVRAGRLGALQRLVGTYGKGLANNGSHMIDLAGFLCDARPLRARACASPLEAGEADWSRGQDAAIDAQIVYTSAAGAQFHLTLLGTDQRAFTCFELRLIGRDAVCELRNGGREVSLHAIGADPDYVGYRVPGPPQDLPAHARDAMNNMAGEALQLALGSPLPSACEVKDALRIAQTVEAIRRSCDRHDAWIDVETLETWRGGAA